MNWVYHLLTRWAPQLTQMNCSTMPTIPSLTSLSTIRYSMMSLCHSSKIWNRQMHCLSSLKFRIWAMIKEGRWFLIWKRSCNFLWHKTRCFQTHNLISPTMTLIINSSSSSNSNSITTSLSTTKTLWISKICQVSSSISSSRHIHNNLNKTQWHNWARQ